MRSDVVEVSRTADGFTRAEFPDGLAIEWDDGAGEALVRAEADMRGLDIQRPRGTAGGDP